MDTQKVHVNGHFSSILSFYSPFYCRSALLGDYTIPGLPFFVACPASAVNAAAAPCYNITTSLFYNSLLPEQNQLSCVTVFKANLLTKFRILLMGHSSIYLYWETSGNSPVEFFIIERSSDTAGWQGIKTIACNSSTPSSLQYFYVDANLKNGTYYYRLKMVDASGAFTYSNGVSAAISDSNTDIHIPEGSVEADQLFIGGITNIEEWDVSVLSTSASLSLKPAILNSNILKVPEIHSGVYLLKLQNRVDGRTKTIRFLKK